jgi:hypothetical protein
LDPRSAVGLVARVWRQVAAADGIRRYAGLMRVKVVAWNMHQNAFNWPRLRSWDVISGAAAYLLCEARADPPEDVVRALHLQMYGSTKETKCTCLPEGDRPICRKRHYSTAIASPSGVEPPIFGPEARVGTWIGGRVQLGAISVTAFALYGLGEVPWTVRSTPTGSRRRPQSTK